MKRLITLIFLISFGIVNAQNYVIPADTTITNSIKIIKGGTFGSAVLMDTNQIKQLDTATDSHDAVPLFQMVDSIDTKISEIDGFNDVDATNISAVKFTKINGSTQIESFGHLHTEYPLATNTWNKQDIDTADIAFQNQQNIFTRSQDLDGNSFNNVLGIGFQDGQQITWNADDYTIDIPTGLGATNQVGQELYTIVYNESGADIEDGKVVKGVGIFNGRFTIEKAQANNTDNLGAGLAVTTMPIPNGAYGIVTKFGNIRDFNTTAFSPSPVLYLSPDVAGNLTNIRPEFPDYVIQIGAALDFAVDGVISIDIQGDRDDTYHNFWNGVFRESFDFFITSDGTTITGSLSPQNGHPDLTAFFSDGFHMFDTSPAATVVLTAGTDAIPTLNYIYVPASTKELTVSTSSFPSEEHIKVATAILQTAATTQTEGAIKNHNYNDHIQGDNGQGHLSHITSRIRRMAASWESGSEGSVTGLPTNAYVQITGGVVYQIHSQVTTAMSMPTDNIHVINDFVAPYESITDLTVISTDALGNNLNNTSFSLVVWGVANKTGEGTQYMVNAPVGTYSKNFPENAINDPDGYSVYTIPDGYRGTGYLIARFTFKNSGGTWTLQDTQDLRGKTPNISAGGVTGGGSAITTLLGLTDTPNTYSGQSKSIVRVNALETAIEFSQSASTIIDGGDSIVLQNEVYDYVQPIFDTVLVHRVDINNNTSITSDLQDTVALHLDTLQAHRTDINSNTNNVSNLQDTIAIHLDSIQALRVDVNNNYDSIAKHHDSLVVHRTDINSLYDSIDNHTDTLQVHRTDINALFDTVAIHLDTLQAIRTNVNTNTINVQLNIDTLAIHRTDINSLFDSIAIHLDTLQIHRTDINTNITNIQINTDSIAVHLDSIQALRVDVNDNYDSIAKHHDTLVQHRIDINKNIDSLALHLDTLQIHRTDINTNIDTLVVHRADINALSGSVDDVIESVDATNISNVKFTTVNGDVFNESFSHVHTEYTPYTLYTNEISDINDTLTEHRTDINSNITDLAAIYDSLSVHNDTLQTHRTDINTNITGIALNVDSIAALRVDVNSNTGNIATNTTNIQLNVDSLAVHRTDINTNITNIATNTADISTNVDSLAVHRTDINANTTNVLTNTDSITVHRTDINNNTANISGNTTNISTLAGLIQLNVDSLAVHRTDINNLNATSHSAVTLSGSYDYITLSGQDIVRGQVDYDTDISNLPTIPTVNDATITIEGTAVTSTPQTFTLNQSGNQTITINDTQAAAQTLSTTGTAGDISISGGNNITLNVDDADNDPTNEIQDLSGIRDTLQFHSDSLVLAFDSLSVHRLVLDSVQDTLDVHRTDINAIETGGQVDATNISNVEFIFGSDTAYESFGHTHTEYALVSQINDITGIEDSLAVHRTDINTNIGLIESLEFDVQANTDDIDDNRDSISVHRTDINALNGGGTVTEVTVGTALDVTNGTTTPDITLDLSEYGTGTAVIYSDELVYSDGGTWKNLSMLNLVQGNASTTSLNTADEFLIAHYNSELTTAWQTKKVTLSTLTTYFNNNITGFVPYTGAVGSVNLNGYELTASDVNVSDETYGSGWNGTFQVPTKNAIYDKIETITTKQIVYSTVSTYTIAADDYFIAFNTGAWVISAIFPTPSATYEGRIIEIKRLGGGNVVTCGTIIGTGAFYLTSAVNTISITNSGDSRKFICALDGATWRWIVIGGIGL